MQKEQISIIGLGWLGLPLATRLRGSNFSIKGSTTSAEKQTQLQQQNLNTYKILFTEEEIIGNIKDCLEGSTTLILNTPPGLRRNPESNYVAKIEKLIPFIEASSIKNILFIGSTAVFADAEIPVTKITNETVPNATSVSGIQLQKVENLLKENKNFNTTILRFAGLVDERRHPATMISKRKQIPNPEAPVNLIHREDCIGIIQEIIFQRKWNNTFNAAFPLHTTKTEYYTNICRQMQLSEPDFNTTKTSRGKLIDGTATVKALSYIYKHTILKK